MTEENSELLRRLEKVEDVAKDSLEDLANSIRSLKEDANSWFGLAREVRSTVPDVKRLMVKSSDIIDSETLSGTS